MPRDTPLGAGGAGLVAVLLALAQLPSLSAQEVRSCNGHPDFCRLRVDQYTFAGAHNANCYGLSVPTVIEDLPLPHGTKRNIVNCLYENQDLSIARQLEFGIRAFSVDLSRKPEGMDGAGEWFSQHGHSDPEIAWGAPMKQVIGAILAFLELYRDEVVVLYVDNVRGWSGTTVLLLEQLLGQRCERGVAIPEDSASAPKLTCLVLPLERPSEEILGNYTLRNLIDANSRLLLFDRVRYMLPNTYSEDFKTQDGKSWIAITRRIIQDVASEQGAEGPTFYFARSWIISAFGSISIDMEKVKSASSNLVCLEAAAQNINRYAMTPDPEGELYKPSQSRTSCDDLCGCDGYLTRLEVLHQEMLLTGQHMFLVLVDHPQFSDLPNMVKRINLATLRALDGQPEASAPFSRCQYGQAIIAGGCIAFVVLLVAFFWIAHCCGCIDCREIVRWICCRKMKKRKGKHKKHPITKPEWAKDERSEATADSYASGSVATGPGVVGGGPPLYHGPMSPQVVAPPWSEQAMPPPSWHFGAGAAAEASPPPAPPAPAAAPVPRMAPWHSAPAAAIAAKGPPGFEGGDSTFVPLVDPKVHGAKGQAGDLHRHPIDHILIPDPSMNAPIQLGGGGEYRPHDRE